MFNGCNDVSKSDTINSSSKKLSEIRILPLIFLLTASCGFKDSVGHLQMCAIVSEKIEKITIGKPYLKSYLGYFYAENAKSKALEISALNSAFDYALKVENTWMRYTLLNKISARYYKHRAEYVEALNLIGKIQPPKLRYLASTEALSYSVSMLKENERLVKDKELGGFVDRLEEISLGHFDKMCHNEEAFVLLVKWHLYRGEYDRMISILRSFSGVGFKRDLLKYLLSVHQENGDDKKTSLIENALRLIESEDDVEKDRDVQELKIKFSTALLSPIKEWRLEQYKKIEQQYRELGEIESSEWIKKKMEYELGKRLEEDNLTMCPDDYRRSYQVKYGLPAMSQYMKKESLEEKRKVQKMIDLNDIDGALDQAMKDPVLEARASTIAFIRKQYCETNNKE